MRSTAAALPDRIDQHLRVRPMPTVSRIRPADGPAVAYAVALRDGAVQQHVVRLGCAPGAQRTGAWSTSR